MSVPQPGRGPVAGPETGPGLGPGTGLGLGPGIDPLLDPGVLELIRWSAGWLSQMPDAFVDRLQADIATLIPDQAPGGRAFCERMVQAMLWAALTDDPPRAVADSLRWVGMMNYLDGFPEEQYVNVAHALVRAVHDLTGMHWSTSMGSAWISYFMWIRPYLVEGAQQAAAQQTAAWQATRDQDPDKHPH